MCGNRWASSHCCGVRTSVVNVHVINMFLGWPGYFLACRYVIGYISAHFQFHVKEQLFLLICLVVWQLAKNEQFFTLEGKKWSL